MDVRGGSLYCRAIRGELNGEFTSINTLKLAALLATLTTLLATLTTLLATTLTTLSALATLLSALATLLTTLAALLAATLIFSAFVSHDSSSVFEM
jgi:hypothetical protein